MNNDASLRISLKIAATTGYVLGALIIFGNPAEVGAETITFDNKVLGERGYAFDGSGDGRADVIFTTSDPLGFNTVGPGFNMNYIREPGLEGSAFINPSLRMDFVAGARSSLTFDFALSTPAETGFATIKVYDSNSNLLASRQGTAQFTFNQQMRSSFPEARLSVNFTGTASYATIGFTTDAPRYIIDNLQYDSPKVYGLYIGADSPQFNVSATAQKVATTFQKSLPGYAGSSFLTTGVSNIDITVDQVSTEIGRLKKLLKPGDTLITYIAGHGGPVANTSDETTKTAADEAIALGEHTYVTDDQLAAMLSGMPEVKKLTFLDACKSGGFWGNNSPSDSGDLEKLEKSAMFAAALEDGDTHATIFSHEGFFSLELIAGTELQKDGYALADTNKDRNISIDELDRWFLSKPLRGGGPVSGVVMGAGDIVDDVYAHTQRVNLYNLDPNEGLMSGTAPDVGALPVPEPATVYFMILGIGIVLFRRRVAGLSEVGKR